jgi:hypothetical protein
MQVLAGSPCPICRDVLLWLFSQLEARHKHKKYQQLFDDMQSFDSSQGRVKACVMSQFSIKPIHYTLNELRLKAAKMKTGNLWVPVARSGFRPPV